MIVIFCKFNDDPTRIIPIMDTEDEIKMAVFESLDEAHDFAEDSQVCQASTVMFYDPETDHVF